MLHLALKKLLNRFGYDIKHLPTDPQIRNKLYLLKKNNIDLIFDVGANLGQFARNMRDLGYKKEIVSFEPLPEAFNILSQNTVNDENWKIVNIAIGNFDGEITMHIAKNSYSSSILDILPRHIESAPDSIFIDQIKVPIKKVDTIIDQYYEKGNNLLIKIDTQGYERQVFEGSLESLGKVRGFQIELSLTSLYRGETLIQEMIDLLRDYGFKIMHLEPGHQDYFTGEILQLEGIFYR